MNLTHLDEKDRPKMVDVSDKDLTTRIAIASGIIEMSQDAYDAVVSEKTKKDQLSKPLLLQQLWGLKRQVMSFLCVTHLTSAESTVILMNFLNFLVLNLLQQQN
jgi:molybdenum cofactor biosynthesis enzyme